MKKYLATLFFAFALVVVAQHAFADSLLTPDPTDYKLLAPIPGIETSPGQSNIATYIPNMIKTVIGLATALAVLLVIKGGAQYILSASFNGKKDGGDTIKDALLGLLFLSVSWILLYTLNPKLVQFSLSLDNVGSGVKIDTELPSTLPAPTTFPDSDTGGANSAGAVAVGCTNNCIAMDPDKLNYGSNACSTFPNCYVNVELEKRLEATKSAVPTLGFRVTEAFPPLGTVPHSSSCHAIGPNSGMCVDASISNSSDPTSIGTFLKAVRENVGPSFQWETKTSAACAALKNNSSLIGYTNYIVWNSGASGPHAHINLNGSAKQDTPCTTDTKAVDL